MTRHQGFDVRISPDVKDSLQARGAPAGLPTQVRHAMNRLRLNGTRALGVRKLASLDMWEIRIGDQRAYFCAVPDTRVLAVGALVPKRTKRHRSDQLKAIESRVHRWRDVVEDELR